MTQASGPNVYNLELPASLSKLHSVFNVSQLNAYQGPVPMVPDPIKLDGSFQYEVEAILYHWFVGYVYKYIQ